MARVHDPLMRRLVDVQEQMLGEMQSMRGDITGMRGDIQGLSTRIDRLVENQGEHYRQLEARVDRLERMVLPSPPDRG